MVQSGRGMALKFSWLAGRTKTTRIFPPDRGEPLKRASVRVKQRGEGTSCLPLSGEDSAISHLAVDHTCHSQMPALSFLPGRGRERGGGGERPLQVSIKRFKSFPAESETRPEDAARHAGGALVRDSCHDDGDEGNKTDGEDNGEIGRRKCEGRRLDEDCYHSLRWLGGLSRESPSHVAALRYPKDQPHKRPRWSSPSLNPPRKAV